MTVITNKIQDAFYDAVSPLQAGQVADHASTVAMRAGGSGCFIVENKVIIGDFVQKGAEVTYPNSHVLQPYAIKSVDDATTQADLVGVVVIHLSAMTDESTGLPSMGGSGKKMAGVALVGSGVVVGATLAEGNAVNGGIVYISVDSATSGLRAGAISATAGAGKIDSGAKFFGAGSQGSVVRIKL